MNRFAAGMKKEPSMSMSITMMSTGIIITMSTTTIITVRGN